MSASKPESALKSFLSGGFGGACCVLVGHPLDLVKVRMQASTTSSLGVFATMQRTFVAEGARGLYRGVSAPLTATTPMFAVSFWSYDMGKRVVQMLSSPSENNGGKDFTFTIPQICMAGALSSFPTVTIMAPSERIKCLLQTQASNPKYTGMLHCAQDLYKTGGMASIYKGTFATLLRDVPGSIAYFGVYEYVKRTMINYQQSLSHGDDADADADTSSSTTLSPVAIMTAGGFAGMACWGVSIPADVIKSRYQIAPEGQYKNLFEVFTTLVKTEGYGALFRGMQPALMRAFPANAAAFMGMEASRSVLSFMD